MVQPKRVSDSDIKLEPREIPWGEDHLPYYEKDRALERECDESPNKIWVDGYIKMDGSYVRGYCRKRKDDEMPNPEYKKYGIKPYIRFAGRKSRYMKTETENEAGHFNDHYESSSGYHLLHHGKNHHVYVEE